MATEYFGFGTEKIEEDMKLILPEARVKRMDLDTTRSRYSYQQIISSFDHGDTDVLIGTQMITKGLDFGNVIMVGIMDADQILNFDVGFHSLIEVLFGNRISRFS